MITSSPTPSYNWNHNHFIFFTSFSNFKRQLLVFCSFIVHLGFNVPFLWACHVRSRLFSFVCLLTSSLVVSMLLFFSNGIQSPTPTSHLCSLKHVLFPTFLCATLFDCQSADVLSPIGLLISSMLDYVFWCIHFQPTFCILLTDVIQFLPHTLHFTLSQVSPLATFHTLVSINFLQHINYCSCFSWINALFQPHVA